MKVTTTAIRVTLSDGEKIIINREIDRAVFTRVCPYDGKEYETENQTQVFCCKSHRVMYCKKNRN